MAQQDKKLGNLKDQLLDLAEAYDNATSIVALDDAGRERDAPLTKDQMKAAADAYREAAKHMNISCRQLVLGIRITPKPKR